MKPIKTFLQFVEWIVRYGLLSPAQRRLLARRFPARSLAHSEAEACPADLRDGNNHAIPALVPGLMLVIIGCVVFVTACSLWFVSQGWVEALYDIPIFVISVFVALLYRGIKQNTKP